MSVKAAFLVTGSWGAGGVSFVFSGVTWPWAAGGVSAAPPHPRRPARCLVGERCRIVGGRGRVRRPPHPRRPARCRCRVRVGAGLGCGRPARGERAAKTRTALPAFLRKDPFAFLLHFAACRAETLLRSGDWLMDDCLMVVWYGERRGFPSRFLSPEPLSCTAGRGTGSRDVDGAVENDWMAVRYLSGLRSGNMMSIGYLTSSCRQELDER